MPVFADLEGVVVGVGVDEIGGDLEALGGEDGAGDDEAEDGEEVGPEDDPFLLGEVDVGLDVHLALQIRCVILLRRLRLVQGCKCLLVLHNVITVRPANKIIPNHFNPHISPTTNFFRNFVTAEEAFQ